MRVRPERRAARAFSRTPPTGSTRPRSVISPVMATSERTGIPVSSDTIAVAMVTPAEGPSFGVAPAGTWTWTSFRCNESAMSSSAARQRTYERAA